MKYCLQTFRDAGLEARWTKKANGQWIIEARLSERLRKLKHDERWLRVDRGCRWWMRQFGILEGFRQWAFLARYFGF